MKKALLCLAIAGSTFVTGCATTDTPVAPKPSFTEIDPLSKQRNRVRVSSAPLVDAAPVIIRDTQWLEDIKVSFSEPRDPIPVSELVRMLRQTTDINITSQLPLGDYLYRGYGLTDVDGVTAMDVIFGSIGLDYEIDTKYKVVRVIPVSEKTWVLNIGPRQTTFASGGSSGTSAAAGASASAASGGVEGIVGSQASNQSEGTSTVRQDEDFWAALSAELEARMTHLIPVKSQRPEADPNARITGIELGGGGRAAPIAVAPPSDSSDETEFFREVKIGRLTVNPVNGSITVQAPKTVLAKLDTYIQEIENRMGTVLEFEGRLILVTNSNAKSEGVDLSAFRSFAENKYGFVFRNNALDGLTVSPPPAFSATSASTISGNILGAINSDALNPMSVFLAFLESRGQVTTMQRPKLSTTSGVPVSASQFDRTYVNIITEQNQASGIAGAVASRQNSLIPFEFGVNLRISPRYDPDKGQVRALISLLQIVQSGTTQVDQFVTGPGGQAQPIRTTIPLDRRIEYQGDALLRDGDLIILGGQSVTITNERKSGITGTSGIPFLRHLLGRSESDTSESVYYFALQVKTRKP